MCLFPCGSVLAFTELGHLTLEGRTTPSGIDELTPRFGWQINSDENEVMQTSYRILVATREEKLNDGSADMWDSGVVESDASQWVPYKGKPLQPDSRYFWKVIVTTNKGGKPSVAQSGWSTGLLSPDNWAGRWIGLDGLAPGDTLDRHSVVAPRYMRSEFKLAKKIGRATLHISGLGNYVAYINGHRIGNDVLAPLPTDYSKTVAYDSYDITALLKKNNAVGVVVAAGNFTGMVQNFQTNVRTSYGLPRLIADIIVEYADGSKQTIATDESWRLTTDGPIRTASGYDGELHDYRLDLGDWTRPGYDDRKWRKAQLMTPPSGVLRGNIAPNMHVYSAEKPVSIRKTGGRHIVDFGTNGAGRVRLKMNVAEGCTVRIRHAELLDRSGCHVYTENLRGALATATFISDGRPRVFSPDFTYYGFRYVEIEGLGEIDMSDISRELIADEMDDGNTSIVIHDMSGNDILEKIIANARRGIRSNYKGMPVDCPQRDERMPWLGDRTTGCIGESYMVGNHALYSKWVKDICDSQRKDGNISDVSPAYWRLYNGNVTWPAALPFACDMLYRQYGDLRPMTDCYDNIKKFLLFLKNNKYEDGIIVFDKYGDWCVPPESPELIHSKDPARKTDGSLISTAYYIYLCRLMERYAGIIGAGDDDARYFGKEADISGKAFNRRFWSDGKYSNGTVTANLLPLSMGLVEAADRQQVADSLIKTIVEVNDSHISTGVIGIQWLMRYLSESGNGDLAYRIATNRDYPGWGYMVEQGATTIWELWNGDTADPSMNSCNHVMLLGDFLIWCYEYIGGIRPDAANPGFKHIIYKPDYSVKALSGAEVSHPSPYGVISAKWELKGDGYLIEVNIPHNTTADIYLPSGEVRSVGSGKHAFEAGQTAGHAVKTPVMGWSSWNTYHVDISDPLIRSQADAMVELGLKDAGYRYINIDDGFFGGRDSDGKLLVHPVRFPDGLKPVADHIHGLGLKAGIYSDGGRNTCGNYYDNDTIAVGVGFYGHDRQDADFFFKECGFDFIKIDFCGGDPKGNHERLDLDEKERYTAIRKAIDATGRKDVRINICRWDYPGTWVGSVGDSWRISQDIRPRWSSLKNIIGQNLYLSAYASDGHYNDMDMLEVGRGMSMVEDKTHFGLWCIMSSPLLIGCDLNSIKPETLDLLKNEELISLNQDPLALQAYVAENVGGVYLLVKDIKERYGTTRAVAVYNSTDEKQTFRLNFRDVDLGGDIRVRDLFAREDMGVRRESMELEVEPHGTRIMSLDADNRLMRGIYEAETAYLSRYQELDNNQAVCSPVYIQDDSCSGGMGVAFLGMRPDNDLQWRDVFAFDGGEYHCSLSVVGELSVPVIVTVNGKDIHRIDSEADLSFPIHLDSGNNIVGLYTPAEGWMPTIDCMRLSR
ncbi:MAG: family 78 glycoside hydrolase catalytic domain [Bacteroidales bacterium]|nr:family 78 glycoside hydrolase catalytic domain [Bacteroidales bacterium]